MIYSYINTRENWKNSKLCENTPPCGRRVSTQFLVFPISTRVDITVYQHGKCLIFLKYNRPKSVVKNEALAEFLSHPLWGALYADNKQFWAYHIASQTKLSLAKNRGKSWVDLRRLLLWYQENDMVTEEKINQTFHSIVNYWSCTLSEN